MTNQAVEGQPGLTPQTPPAPQVAAAPAPAPADAPGQHAQPTIKVGDKVFAADDVTGILNAKTGLEAENKAIKAKLDAFETAQLSEKERLEKQIKETNEENAKLKRENLDTKVGQALRDKGIAINPKLLNLGVTDESQIETAVQNLIKENPALVSKSPGATTFPPGTVPPAAAPPSADVESEIKRKFETAKTTAEFAQADKELAAMRGTTARKEDRII
jgi:hypothetical protein